MREKQPRKKSDEGRDGSNAFYVYCVGARAQLSPLMEGILPEAIEGGATLELVAAADLAAITSRVPLNDYDEQPLKARLDDAAWTAIRAMRHERVMEYFASRSTVIPLRFGAIYLTGERIEEMLAERAEELRRIIERLSGREEWGVNVYRDRRVLMEAITILSRRLRELSEQAEAASPGQAYLLKKKIDSMKSDEARIETRRVVEEIEQKLSSASDSAARLRVLKDEAGEHGEVAAKMAFLVERSRFDEFRARAESLAAEHAASGFRLELTGPWPAYNFAGEDREAERPRGQKQ
jgi:hypothetical protein